MGSSLIMFAMMGTVILVVLLKDNCYGSETPLDHLRSLVLYKLSVLPTLIEHTRVSMGKEAEKRNWPFVSTGVSHFAAGAVDVLSNHLQAAAVDGGRSYIAIPPENRRLTFYTDGNILGYATGDGLSNGILYPALPYSLFPCLDSARAVYQRTVDEFGVSEMLECEDVRLCMRRLSEFDLFVRTRLSCILDRTDVVIEAQDLEWAIDELVLALETYLMGKEEETDQAQEE